MTYFKPHIKFLVLEKWQRSLKSSSIETIIFIIKSEFMDLKQLESLLYSWDQVFIMPLLTLYIKQDSKNRNWFNSGVPNPDLMTVRGLASGSLIQSSSELTIRHR